MRFNTRRIMLIALLTATSFSTIHGMATDAATDEAIAGEAALKKSASQIFIGGAAASGAGGGGGIVDELTITEDPAGKAGTTSLLQEGDFPTSTDSFAQAKTQLETLAAELATQRSMYAALEASLAAKNEEVVALTTELNEKKARCTFLENDGAELRKGVRELEKRCKNHEANADYLRGAWLKAQQELDALKKK